MNESLDEKRTELLEKISQMPPKTQHALAWLVQNYDEALRMCQAKKLTAQERSQLEEIAEKRDDQLLRLLLIMERSIHGD